MVENAAQRDRDKRRVRRHPKGRVVDRKIVSQLQDLLGGKPYHRDLLVEYLHKLQDTHGHIPAPHLVALASEMRLSVAEVYEVATFYHHFDVVGDGDAPPAPITMAARAFSCFFLAFSLLFFFLDI